MKSTPELGRLTRYVPSFLLPPVLWFRNTAYGKAYTRRRWSGVWDEAVWHIRRAVDTLMRSRVLLLGETQRRKLVEKLATGPLGQDVAITATIACRKKNNRDSVLPVLLESMIALATDIRRVEVVVKIDPDDDIYYFAAIKKKYQASLNIRIFVTDRMGGYPDGHYFHQFLVDQANPASKVWIVLTDDSQIILQGWDDFLMEAYEKGNGFFIGGDKDLEKILPNDAVEALEADNLPAHYMANDYPFASFSVLKTIKKAIDDPKWTHFGDEFCFDCFFSAIVSKTYFTQGVNLYVQAPKFVRRGGVQVFLDIPQRNKARTEAVIRFMSPESEARREKVAQDLAAIRKSV